MVERGSAVQEGRPAPEFELTSDSGALVSLASLRGEPVILYFSPKDDTPGCTAQACGIRDAWGEFERAGAVVLGVSPDNTASHVRFKEKYELPFPRLADADHKSPRSTASGARSRCTARRTWNRALHVRDRCRRQRRQGAAEGEAGHARRRRARRTGRLVWPTHLAG